MGAPLSVPTSPFKLAVGGFRLKDIITPEVLAATSASSQSSTAVPPDCTKIHEVVDFLIKYVKALELDDVVTQERFLERLMETKGQLNGVEQGTNHTNDDARRKLFCWLSLPEKKLNDYMRDQLKNLGWSDEEAVNWETMYEGNLFWAFV
ncbi:hypothetical protein LTR85_002495 [Meristemomyces frigidus]|nr:hypothetical protein LTR85_002495 [Meristemomyces frigidus]